MPGSRPRTLTLHSHRIKISYRRRVLDPESGEMLMGLAEPNLGRISVATHCPHSGEKLPDANLRHNLFHEVGHYMFYLAGRMDLYEDEPLVDLVGGMISQLVSK